MSAIEPFLCLFLQPTDDIVLMAQTLEKIFLQKVASMPQEEQELVVTIPKNSHKKGAKLAGRKWGPKDWKAVRVT